MRVENNIFRRELEVLTSKRFRGGVGKRGGAKQFT